MSKPETSEDRSSEVLETKQSSVMKLLPSPRRYRFTPNASTSHVVTFIKNHISSIGSFASQLFDSSTSGYEITVHGSVSFFKVKEKCKECADYHRDQEINRLKSEIFDLEKQLQEKLEEMLKIIQE